MYLIPYETLLARNVLESTRGQVKCCSLRNMQLKRGGTLALSWIFQLRLAVGRKGSIWIVRLALNRPYTFVVLALLLSLIAPVMLLRTPVDIFPEINIPVVSIIWTYSGLVPQGMESRITSIYERALTTTVGDIDHIESQSYYGMCVIKVGCLRIQWARRSLVIRAVPGEDIQLTYVNAMSTDSQERCIDGPCMNMTNLHFHGLYVSPNSLQDDVICGSGR
jgi:hypothetical protein